MDDKNEFSKIVRDEFPNIGLTDNFLDFMYKTVYDFRVGGYYDGYKKALGIVNKIGDVKTTLILMALSTDRLN